MAMLSFFLISCCLCIGNAQTCIFESNFIGSGQTCIFHSNFIGSAQTCFFFLNLFFFPDECITSEVEDGNIVYSIKKLVVCVSTYVVDVYETCCL